MLAELIYEKPYHENNDFYKYFFMKIFQMLKKIILIPYFLEGI